MVADAGRSIRTAKSGRKTAASFDSPILHHSSRKWKYIEVPVVMPIALMPKNRARLGNLHRLRRLPVCRPLAPEIDGRSKKSAFKSRQQNRASISNLSIADPRIVLNPAARRIAGQLRQAKHRNA
jgi:hypothetical protein